MGEAKGLACRSSRCSLDMREVWDNKGCCNKENHGKSILAPEQVDGSLLGAAT